MGETTITTSDGAGYLRMSWQPPEELCVWVGSAEYSGAAKVSTFLVGSPEAFFRDMAAHWRGWHGEKGWSDHEERARLTATTDSLGHISLRVRLRDSSFTNSIDVVLVLEAGQLDAAARAVDALFAGR